ncbi:MAG: hypothetical protein LBM98_08415 [Oscillospiraceae bacterium]|nr:hypothetical protein [Oscillospiraceae bacterium]
MRYVGRIGARQSSAGSVTYVCFAPGTGLLRTCNTVRIAGLPVLRNDGRGFALAPAGRTPRLIPPKPPSLEGGAASAAGGAVLSQPTGRV